MASPVVADGLTPVDRAALLLPEPPAVLRNGNRYFTAHHVRRVAREALTAALDRDEIAEEIGHHFGQHVHNGCYEPDLCIACAKALATADAVIAHLLRSGYESNSACASYVPEEATK